MKLKSIIFALYDKPAFDAFQLSIQPPKVLVFAGGWIHRCGWGGKVYVIIRRCERRQRTW
ncbi:MAG: hypothetical protein OEW43_03565 [Elusimicrobiota bacterium]|nr:hypothetical protein [Elusimicrobiota bacterium]MDH5661496.1 hypothetical protein [Elusimicrobiota bacterium]